MIDCKKHIIAVGFTLILPLTGWAEAPVVDDSDNFAIMEDHQQTYDAPVGEPKYDEPLVDNSEVDQQQSDLYQTDQDVGSALVKEDTNSESKSHIDDNAKLIDKITTLEKEIQELRGQQEVQAHDLKLMQQQQVAFYKDIDARLGSTSAKVAQNKPITDLALGTSVAAQSKHNATSPVSSSVVQTTVASRVNPADEQISYLAAYELVKNKHYDEAINAMRGFVLKYPSGGYTSNAEYWLGELYLAKKEYPKAIEHFELVLSKYPSSSKSAASMLKAGYAYAATGDKQKAKSFFQQVVRRFPGTSTAQLASSKLESFNAL